MISVGKTGRGRSSRRDGSVLEGGPRRPGRSCSRPARSGPCPTPNCWPGSRRGRGDASAEAAFAALVDRHGPMVLGVCRRVTGDRHAADDAFQAVFLVLARKAHAVRLGADDSLGRWLYGVSLRVARRARAVAGRRPVAATDLDGLDPVDPSSSSTPASGPTSAPRSTPRSPACRPATDRRWCSATWRGSPRSRPPGGSAARSARWRAACTGRGSVCGRAWPGGAWRRRSGRWSGFWSGHRGRRCRPAWRRGRPRRRPGSRRARRSPGRRRRRSPAWRDSS